MKMAKKVTPPVTVVPAEPPKPKIIERWGATEETWMLGHEDDRITLNLRSGGGLSGHLLGTDRYTVTIEDDNKRKLIVYKHAIDFIGD
jgi:hypothetical protein